nr:Ig-like domain-containing protein [Agromyces seonyuensis]
MVAAYSAAEGGVRRFDATTGTFSGGLAAVTDAPGADTRVELGLVGSHWVLVDADGGRVWIDGGTPIDAGFGADALVQASAAAGDELFVADSSGLVSVDLRTGAAERLVEANGVPAAPLVVDGTAYAAWIGQTGGTLWTSAHRTQTVPLAGDEALAEVQAIVPVLRGNGDRLVVNETSSGLVWTSDGDLVPLEQWSQNEEDDERSGTVEVDDVAQQEPPVARDDRFGVRAGAIADLPVLLNDSDPNKKDVLSIVPTLGGLSDPAFGTVGLVAENQRAVATVAAGATSASFQYQVTDGSATSAPATVTLDVVPAGQNSPPVWCPVDGCTLPAPSAQVEPGGTAVVSALRGWVDPEGDPLVLAAAVTVDPEAPLDVVITDDGRLAIRHTDPNGAGGIIAVLIAVEDSFGARTKLEIPVTVTGSPVLEAAPVAVSAAPGEQREVDIADHVQGGSGSYRLLDAAPSAPIDGLSVAADSAAGSIRLSAEQPGEYVLAYSVQDTETLAEKTAVLRLTVAEGSAIAAPSLTVFVRPNQDATVDVLDTVAYRGGRVLYIESAAAVEGTLTVDVVDLDRVRVGGTTPDGGSGRIGTARIRIADGAGAVTEAQLTVFLLAAPDPQAPVARADTATVRAGGTIDVDVLDNDVAPRGERLVVLPGVEGSGADGELVFSDGDVVRYLAPKTAGVYAVTYSAALESDADRRASGILLITVLADGVNRSPVPTALAARVGAGETVSIPVPLDGVDPDGDTVALVDVTQAEAGAASIAATGDAIRFRAPDDGVPGGLATFEYSVRDGDGERGTATVRVAVVPESGQVQPVAFSDYVRIAAGSPAPVVVEPLRNDRDPAGGDLELVAIKPNVPDAEGNAEFGRLRALIDPSTDLREGKIVLLSGDQAGPASFIVTIRSKLTSSTAEGLLVLEVTQSASAEQPVVSDTIVTASDRADLSGGGIDVVAGKVAWAGGDVADLDLEVWGDAASRYEAEGTRISGPEPAKGAVVPFRVSGQDASGNDVEAFGFLRIPAFEDYRLELRSGFTPILVDEEKTVEFSIDDILDLPADTSVEIRDDDSFRVGRANASCTPVDDDTAAYSTGREAPWSDTCLLPVRLEGQSAWSGVAVPIALRPKDPLAILSPISRTVAPAATETVDLLASMTTWEGGRVGDDALLDYRATYVGASFTVVQTGATVTAEAHADAKPGAKESISIDVSNFGGLHSTITLVVGIAPPDAPRGATFTATCDVSDGADCTVPVVGVAGEYDPFAGKTGSGLKLRSLASSRCEVATVTAANETAVRVVWPGGPTPPGGTCTLTFVVADAQGRIGQGTLSLDIQGYPQKPESVTTSDYGADWVALRVWLGNARLAHPGLTGVRILEGGQDVGADCVPSEMYFTCTLRGLTNGTRHDYTARAVNSVGDSLDTTPVTTNAYSSPQVLGVTPTPVYTWETSTTRGVVDVAIASNSDVAGFRLEWDNGRGSRDVSRDTRNPATSVQLSYSPGNYQLKVTPISQFSPPDTWGQPASGDSAYATLTFAGSPTGPNEVGLVSASTDAISISASFNGNASPRALSVYYLLWVSGTAEPACTADGAGGLIVPDGSSTTGQFTGLTEDQDYYGKACATNGFGVATTRPREFETKNGTGSSGTASYTIGTTPAQSGTTYSYGVTAAPNLSSSWNRNMWYKLYSNLDWTQTFTTSNNQLDPERIPDDRQHRQCRKFNSGDCDSYGVINWVNAPTTAWVTFASTSGCVPYETRTFDRWALASEFVTGVSGAARDSYTLDFVADDTLVDATTGERPATLKLTWTNDFKNLDSITRTMTLCAEPVEPTEPPEPPETTETPTPSPDPGTGG